jgi:hypothetical protein
VSITTTNTDQFAPAINMVQIRQLDDDSILPIMEENPGAESEGSTKTVLETITDIRDHHRLHDQL